MPMPLTDGQRVVPTTRAAVAPPPDPGDFFDQVGDAFTVARADTTGYVEEVELNAYTPVINALEDEGYRFTNFVNPRSGTVSPDAVWRVVLKKREADPKAFADLPATQEEFDRQWREKEAARINAASARGEQAGLASRLIGGIGGAMTDPLNLYTLPIGGFGKTVGQRILTEGLVGAGVETALQGGVQHNREELGLADLTLGEAAANIGFAGLGAAGLRGGFEVAPAAARKLGENIAGDWQRTRDYIWPKLPQSVRDRFGTKEALQADDLPELAEEVIGPENMTQAERDAVDYARDEAETARTPFKPNGAGQQLHHDLIGEAVNRLIDMPPPAMLPVRSAAGGDTLVRPSSRAGRVGNANAFGDATAEARFMERVRSAESSGNDAAKNPRSSATGRYQFIDSTWIRQYVKRYGRGGLTDPQILAKRGNGALQDQLMRDLTAENAAFLRSQGEAVTEGNLYLVHFSGAGGAKKVFTADPNTPIERIWSAEVIRANPFLRGMSAGDVISWAHRKMGQKGNPPRSGEGYQLDDEINAIDTALAREGEELETIRRALDDAYAAEDAARRAAQGEADPESVTAALDAEINPRAFDDAELFDEAATQPSEPLDADDVPELAALRSELADVAHGSKDSLNDIPKLAQRFEASEDEVRAALDGMVARGTLTQNRKTGNYMRKPGSDPDELFESIARYGGIRDDEGHNLGLVDLSARERRELDSNAQRNTRRRRRGNAEGMGLARIMTRAGPLLRHEGKNIDMIGEALWEDGWFIERPTEREVLELIDERLRSGKKMYPPTRTPDPEDARPDWEVEEEEYLLGIKAEAEELGMDPAGLDYEFVDMLASFKREAQAEGYDSPHATMVALNMIAERNQAEAFARNPEADYDPIDYDEFVSARPFYSGEDRAAAGDFGGPRADGEDAPAGRADRGYDGADRGEVANAARLADLTPEQRAPFSDPDGPATMQQADSLVHDMRAGVERQKYAVLPEGDTRGQGIQYHGSRGEMPDLTEGYYNPLNIYGGFETFYTTDASDIAGGYKRKKSEGRIYRVDEVEQVQTFDMEDRLAPDKIAELFDIKDWDSADGFPASAIENAIGEDGKLNLREAMDQTREDSGFEGYSRDDTQEIFDGVIYNLRQRGFGAMRHIGGLKTDRDPHNVKIFFDAPNQLRIIEAQRLKAADTGSPAAAFPPPRISDLQRGASEDEMFAIIRSLPDDEESADLLAKIRSRLWVDEEDAGSLYDADNSINRFDAARDRWDEQFAEAREAEAQGRLSERAEREKILVNRIVGAVEAGSEMRLYNGVRKGDVIYKAGTVRTSPGGLLQVREGQRWVVVPSSQLEEIASKLRVGGPSTSEATATPSLDAGDQTDPAIAARQSEEARLRAEAPLRGGNATGQEQDGTMGLGLFDAADQPEFLLDPAAPGQKPADMLADLDAEEADLKTIRDCL